MPFSYAATVATGSTVAVSVPFGFMSRDHVHVLLDGELVDDADLSWINNGLINLPTAPAVGTAIKVYRDTPKEGPYVVFPEPSPTFSAQDFNRLALATLYIAQENYDANKITADQLGDSIDYINEALGIVADAVTSTQNSANAAAASASEAAGYTTAGELAMRWASAPEDEPVGMGTPVGSFSAKHWAAKAQAAAFGDLDATAVGFTPESGFGEYNVQDAFLYLFSNKANINIPVVLFDDEPAYDPETNPYAPGLIGQRKLMDSTQITKDVSASGLIKLNLVTANQAEAIAGTDAVKVMTALRVADAVKAQVAKWLCGTMYRLAGTTPKPGSVLCDGTEYLRSDKPDLWAYAESSGNIVAEADWSANPAAFSSGDGSTTFRVPNRRGYFERNYVAGGSLDSGRDIGKAQASANLTHGHTGSGSVNLGLVVGSSGLKVEEGGTGTGANNGTNTKSVSVSISPSGGSEARPNNMASLLCMWDGTVPADE